jgi:hypothetical protein
MRWTGSNDRRAVFDYGSDKEMRETCEHLENLNN